MQISQCITDGKAVMSLTGKFIFSSHREFRNGYETLLTAHGINTVDIDFNKVDYIDSSALGSLLLMRELAGTKNIELRITGSKDVVRQILEVANFDRMFQID